MAELDMGNIYSSSGQIVQQRYAQKAADNGSTIIAMCNSRGAVLLVAKPIASKLLVQESDLRIKRVASNVYTAYTGLLTDGFFVTHYCRSTARDYVSLYKEEMNAHHFQETLQRVLYHFTQSVGARVLGANFLAIVKDGGAYRVFGADVSGKVTDYHGYAYGTGGRRAQTEIEKFDFEAMEIRDLVDQGIKTLFKCYDSLSDLPFTVEVGYISDDADGEFMRMSQETVGQIMEKYKNVSVDGEDD
ncbi:20S proteasome subunit alpha 7 [Pancytospora philotis]|nr:20S proteasome subunit alpha 7 [Pancytospora philotis]